MKTRSIARARTVLLAVAVAVLCLPGCGGKQVTAVDPGAAPRPAGASGNPAHPPGRALQGGEAVGAVVGAAAAAAPARPAAPAPLVGHVTRADLEAYETWKALRAQDYTPDTAAIETIAARGKDVRVLVIVATWCPDSKREVPRLFKIYDQARLGMDRVTMVAVDRSKKDAEGLTAKYGILRVPTFVFFRGDVEIGRVTERASTTLDQDIAAIVAK